MNFSGLNDPRPHCEIDMQIDDSYLSSIPVDSQAEDGGRKSAGTKYINIRKGRATETVKAGAELKSLDTARTRRRVPAGRHDAGRACRRPQKGRRHHRRDSGGKGTIGKLLVRRHAYTQRALPSRMKRRS